MNTFWIPENVPSSKNSKQWTGKYFVWSKASQKYVKDTKDFWELLTDKFLAELEQKEKPYNIEFQFVRKSKHKFDYVNPLQTVLDLMVRYKWIEDDNADIIKPFFADYIYDKTFPGVWITIL